LNLFFAAESLIRCLQLGAVSEILYMFMVSKDNKGLRQLSKIRRRSRDRRADKGISLIEVMLAISVLAIVVLGMAFFSFYTSGQVGLGKQYRAALQLAGQKMEQLKADNETGIFVEDGETTEEVASGDLSYTRTTVVEDSGLCKEVTVTVSWNQMGKDRNVRLVSLVVEK